MRRIALVLVVTALVVAMMVSAGPATADVFESGNTGGWANQQLVVIIDDDRSGGNWWDCCHNGWGSHGWGSIDSGDIELDSGDVTFVS